ncbi:MAG TPA: hypothetical protein HA321_02270 [Halobacteriales archaeon]|jgi:hypothetical protein|nr:hypothetical protein [Halobacteriales archaeon]
MLFAYPCPGCRTRSSMHAPECKFELCSRDEIEKAYIDIISLILVDPSTQKEMASKIQSEWKNLHSAIMFILTREQRVEQGELGKIRLLTPAERADRISEPVSEPMRTIYEKGSYPGCHDNALFAMLAWHKMVGFSWEETQEKVTQWLVRSGSWERGGFGESVPKDVIGNKKHVYEGGYGWMEKAQAAKRVIERME